MYLGIPEAFYRIFFRGSYTNKAFWESPSKFSHRRPTGWRYRLLMAKCAGFPNRRKEMVESSKFDSQAHCAKARRLICYYLLTKCWSSNKKKIRVIYCATHGDFSLRQTAQYKALKVPAVLQIISTEPSLKNSEYLQLYQALTELKTLESRCIHANSSSEQSLTLCIDPVKKIFFQYKHHMLQATCKAAHFHLRPNTARKPCLSLVRALEESMKEHWLWNAIQIYKFIKEHVILLQVISQDLKAPAAIIFILKMPQLIRRRVWDTAGLGEEGERGLDSGFKWHH